MNFFGRREIEKNFLQKSIDGYYKFFDDILGNSSVLIGFISIMMLSSVVLVSPHTNANFSNSLKTNILSSKIDKELPTGFININGVKYIIKLEVATDNDITSTF